MFHLDAYGLDSSVENGSELEAGKWGVCVDKQDVMPAWPGT